MGPSLCVAHTPSFSPSLRIGAQTRPHPPCCVVARLLATQLAAKLWHVALQSKSLAAAWPTRKQAARLANNSSFLCELVLVIEQSLKLHTHQTQSSLCVVELCQRTLAHADSRLRLARPKLVCAANPAPRVNHVHQCRLLLVYQTVGCIDTSCPLIDSHRLAHQGQILPDHFFFVQGPSGCSLLDLYTMIMPFLHLLSSSEVN